MGDRLSGIGCGEAFGQGLCGALVKHHKHDTGDDADKDKKR
jgi:hypothetical protein